MLQGQRLGWGKDCHQTHSLVLPYRFFPMVSSWLDLLSPMDGQGA